MKRVLVALGTMVVVGASGGLLACNGLLGIGAASQEAEDGGGGEAAAPELSCEHYCDLMDTNCGWSSKYPEYLSKATCVQMCNVFDTGNVVSSDNTDTLGCRVFYAEKTAQDPTNCRFAGLLGGGKCGATPCVDFCAVDVQYCNSDAIQVFPYKNVQDCQNHCQGVDGGVDGGDGGIAGYPYLSPAAGSGELFNAESGNTLNCRTWHLNNAFGSKQLGLFHCPHTQPTPSPCH